MNPQYQRRRVLAALMAAGAAAVGYAAYRIQRDGPAAQKAALWQERRRMIESIKPVETEGLIGRMGLPAFLAFWNDNVLQRLQRAKFKPDPIQQEILRSGTIFLPAATTEQIHTAEQRLGLQFPASLNAFLHRSNGAKGIIDYHYESLDFLPCEKMGWLNDIDNDLVDIWNKEVIDVPDATYNQYGKGQDTIHMRAQYMRHALVLSPIVDSGVYLLNPQISFPDGEIEAWDFSVKYPGARRYKSFNRLLEEHCSSSCDNIEYWSMSANWEAPHSIAGHTSP